MLGAIKDLTIVVDANSKDVDALYYRAQAFEKLKDFTKAIADYAQIIAINANDGVAYRKRGVAKINANQKESGCTDLARALELKETFANYYMKQYCK